MAAQQFIVENCQNVEGFYLSSNSNQHRKQFYDTQGHKCGPLYVFKDSFTNLDDANGSMITGIMIQIPSNGFHYIVTPECPVMRSSTHTWIFPDAEPQVEGQTLTEKTADSTTLNNQYHCFGISFPFNTDEKILKNFDESLDKFCNDYKQVTFHEVPETVQQLENTIDPDSSISELIEASKKLSSTLFTTATNVIDSQLEKNPAFKKKYEQSKKYANQMKDKLVQNMPQQLKDVQVTKKFSKLKMKLTNEGNRMKNDLKRGDTNSTVSNIDKATKNTVQFIQLATKTSANQIHSVKTVLIQRIPQETTNHVKIDPSMQKKLTQAKNTTKLVTNVGGSVVKAIGVGAGQTIGVIASDAMKVMENSETVSKHINKNPIAYNNIKVVGKKTLNSYLTINAELQNAAVYLFSESAHAAADVVDAKYGSEVGKAVHDSVEVAVNVVEIFKMDKKMIAKSIRESTMDQIRADKNININSNQMSNDSYNASNINESIESAMSQAIMKDWMSGGNMTKMVLNSGIVQCGAMSSMAQMSSGQQSNHQR